MIFSTVKMVIIISTSNSPIAGWQGYLMWTWFGSRSSTVDICKGLSLWSLLYPTSFFFCFRMHYPLIMSKLEEAPFYTSTLVSKTAKGSSTNKPKQARSLNHRQREAVGAKLRKYCMLWSFLQFKCDIQRQGMCSPVRKSKVFFTPWPEIFQIARQSETKE